MKQALSPVKMNPSGAQIMGAFPNFLSQHKLSPLSPVLRPRIDVGVGPSQLYLHPSQHFKMSQVPLHVSQAPLEAMIYDPQPPIVEQMPSSVYHESIHCNASPMGHPVPCHQSSPIHSPSKIPVSPAPNGQQVLATVPASPVPIANRKRKLPMGCQAVQGAASPVVNKASNLAAFPQSSPMMHSPQQPSSVPGSLPQQCMSSPVEASPKTPTVQDPSWMQQGPPLQSPVYYPPTPSPSMPMSPAKHGLHGPASAPVHHMGMVPSQNASMPSSPSSTPTRFMSPSGIGAASKASTALPFKVIKSLPDRSLLQVALKLVSISVSQSNGVFEDRFSEC